MQPDAGSDFAAHSCAELHSHPLPNNNSNAIDRRAVHGDANHCDAILRTNSIADAEVRSSILRHARSSNTPRRTCF